MDAYAYRLAAQPEPLQPLLLDGLAQTVTPDLDDAATIQERFEAFHAANPHVYSSLRRLALAARSRGVRRYGIKGLFEQLRWQYAIQTAGDDFRLNNIYSSRYARLLMDNEPGLAGFFETRRLQAA